MRFDGHRYEWIPLPRADELASIGEALLRRPVVGRGEVIQDLPDKGPQPCFMSGLCHLSFEKIHVTEGGRASQDHLRAGEEGAPVDKLGIDLCLGGEDMLGEPDDERKVVGQAPKTGHGRVGVGVDQPGHHESAFHIEPLTRLSS
jgi:hypothetical protein